MGIEINVIGTGGGYGESIVIKANEDVFIIDSCRDPKNGAILPLKFLLNHEISFENVKLLICTHWHDDHILGISEIFKKCQNSILCYSRVNDLKKFLTFLSLDFAKQNASISSTLEFNKCLEEIKSNKRKYKVGHADQLLFHHQYGDDEFIDIYSLSPSNKSEELFDIEISSLIDDYAKTNKKIPNMSINDRSMVVLINYSNITIMLGSDLEVIKEDDRGWLDILNNSQVVKKQQKACYFKIPHHGSENGFHELIWKNLLNVETVSTLTPYNKSKLPKEEMVVKYKSLSSDLFITSSKQINSKPKRRDNRTEKIIKQFNNSLEEVKYDFGLISSTLNSENADSKINNTWTTKLFGCAKKL